MILTLDIGNTNIKTALFEGMEVRQYWRISTDRNRSSDELGILLMNLLEYNHIFLLLSLVYKYHLRIYQ